MTPVLTVSEDVGTAQVCVTISSAIDVDIAVSGIDGKASCSATVCVCAWVHDCFSTTCSYT